MSWWSSLFQKKPAGPTYKELQDQVVELENVVKEQLGEYRDMRKRLALRLVEAEARLKRAEQVLKFYADRKNWRWELVTADDPAAERDRGRRARHVLGQD